MNVRTMNYFIMQYHIYYYKVSQILKEKINAQLDFDYDLENLDYLDKPIDSRKYLEHLDKIDKLSKKLNITVETKKECLKELFKTKALLDNVPEDCVNYLFDFI